MIKVIRERDEQLDDLKEELRKQEYDFTTVLEMANQIIARSLTTYGLGEFINYIKTTFRGQFGVKNVYLLQKQVIEGTRLQFAGDDVTVDLSRDHALIQYLKDQNEPVTWDRIRTELGEEDKLQLFDELDVNLMMPLARNAGSKGMELQGVLILGEKLLEEGYTDSEMQFLSLLGRLIAISLHNANLHQKSIRDSLTRLYTRGHFDLRLREQVRKIRRDVSGAAPTLSVVMMDIDHFKSFNDEYGHQTGDEVLKAVASSLQESTRENDLVARYGGEEFASLAPDANVEQGRVIGQRLRRNVEEIRVKDEENRELSVTISVGVSTLPDHAVDAQTLVSKADQALYSAKEKGRNQVVSAEVLSN